MSTRVALPHLRGRWRLLLPEWVPTYTALLGYGNLFVLVGLSLQREPFGGLGSARSRTRPSNSKFVISIQIS